MRDLRSRSEPVAPAGGEPLELLGKGTQALVRASGAAAHEGRELAERALQSRVGRALTALSGRGSLARLVAADGPRRSNIGIRAGSEVKFAAAVGCPVVSRL